MFSRMINRLMLKMAISLGTHEVKPPCHFNQGSQATLVEGDRLASPPAIERRVYCGPARDFRHGGPAAIAKCAQNQPAAYCKLLTLLCPRDVKVEHSGSGQGDDRRAA